MSRVTIGQLTEDLVPYTEKGNKVANIEIVPRKIVEDVITKCQEEMEEAETSEVTDFHSGIWEGVYRIQNYAENLLMEFERANE